MSPAERSGTRSGAEPSRVLIGEWAVCAIASAAARFVPIPLLDDVVKYRAIRIAVLRTLRANGRLYPSSAVEALYLGVDTATAGMIRRAFGYVRTVPRRVLLFPVRKYVALFGSVRGVPTDVMTVLLLARSVHRSLVAGRLTGPAGDVLTAESIQVRTAFDAAIEGMDLRLLSGALADGLSEGRGLTMAAVAYARRTFGRPGNDLDSDQDSREGLTPGGAVGAGAERVEEVLRRPEIARLLAEFDAHFDRELARSS